jgi:outer membrane immunogenic protein
MKRRLIAGVFALAAGGQAFAADLPMPAPVPPQAYVPVVPFYNWTGFYIGINGGGALGNSNWLDPVLGNSGNFTTSGFLIGGTVGANYQVGSFVFGVEGDGDW